MIRAYFRPKTLADAVKLFSEPGEQRVPLGGGSVLSRARDESYAVVDLQDLGLDSIELEGNRLKIGAVVKLEKMVQSSLIPQEMKPILLHSASLNIRNQATIGGYLVCADGRSPLAIALLALDAEMVWHPGEKKQSLGDWLALRQRQGLFVTTVYINANSRLKYAQVARSPMDQPIIAVAIARWRSGRTRIALGGFGAAPVLALDGPEPGGAAEAVRNACSNAGDCWASAEYRQDAAFTLTHRLMEELAG